MNINDILLLIFISAIITAMIVMMFYRGLNHLLQKVRYAILPARYLKKSEIKHTTKTKNNLSQE